MIAVDTWKPSQLLRSAGICSAFKVSFARFKTSYSTSGNAEISFKLLFRLRSSTISSLAMPFSTEISEKLLRAKFRYCSFVRFFRPDKSSIPQFTAERYVISTALAIREKSPMSMPSSTSSSSFVHSLIQLIIKPYRYRLPPRFKLLSVAALFFSTSTSLKSP